MTHCFSPTIPLVYVRFLSEIEEQACAYLYCFTRAKVCQLNDARIIYKNICALDVAMHNLMPMEVLKSEQNLLCVDLNHLFAKLAKFL
jgi:hypothetical protein